MTKSALAGFVCAALMLLPGTSRASTIVFDFEEAAEGTTSSYTETESGLSMTLTRVGIDFAFQNISGFNGPTEFGARTVSPFDDPFTSELFNVNFSAPVNSVEIFFGDYGQDSDDTITMQAFSGLDGTGVLLGTVNGSWGLQDFSGDAPASMIIAAAGIQSIRFIGGSSIAPQSLYWDNLTVNSVAAPEPAVLTLLGGGLAAVSARHRKRRGTAKER